MRFLKEILVNHDKTQKHITPAHPNTCPSPLLLHFLIFNKNTDAFYMLYIIHVWLSCFYFVCFYKCFYTRIILWHSIYSKRRLKTPIKLPRVSKLDNATLTADLRRQNTCIFHTACRNSKSLKIPCVLTFTYISHQQWRAMKYSSVNKKERFLLESN